MRPPLIPSLLARGGPPAIAGRVPPRIVDPVDRIASRTRPHVFEEQGERFPTIADRDAAAAIQGVSVVGRYGAARPHRSPCPVLAGPVRLNRPAASRNGLLPSGSRDSRLLSGSLSSEAAARTGEPGGQGGGMQRLPLATPALALPERPLITRPCPAEYAETAEPLARQITEGWHAE